MPLRNTSRGPAGRAWPAEPRGRNARAASAIRQKQIALPQRVLDEDDVGRADRAVLQLRRHAREAVGVIDVAGAVVGELGGDAVGVDRRAGQRAGGRDCRAGDGVRAERERLARVEVVAGAGLAGARAAGVVVAGGGPDRVAVGVVLGVRDIGRWRRRPRARACRPAGRKRAWAGAAASRTGSASAGRRSIHPAALPSRSSHGSGRSCRRGS